MSAKVMSRSGGGSAVDASAYRSGEKMKNARTGEMHDYTRKQGVDYSEILIPNNCGAWALDREELWNRTELAEKRKDAQLCREINIAIPVELTASQGWELVSSYARNNFVSMGMIADINIHGANTNNPHAHIMLTMREATQDGFGQKVREWNDKNNLERWRGEWAKECNRTLSMFGHDVSVNHRSYAEQGIDRIPSIHLGKYATRLEKQGIESDRGDINREIKEANTATAELERVNAEIEKLQNSEERRQWKEKIDKAFEDEEKNPDPKGIKKEIKERLGRLKQENISKHDELNIHRELVDLYKVLSEHQYEADKRQREERRAEKEAEGQKDILEREFAHCYKYGLTPESDIDDARNVFDKRMLEENKEYAKEKEILSKYISTRGGSPSGRVHGMQEEADGIKRRLANLKNQYQELKQEHDGKIFFGKKKLAEQMEKVKGQYQNAVKKHEGVSKELDVTKQLAVIEEKHGHMFGDSPERKHWAKNIMPSNSDYYKMESDLKEIDERMEKAPPSFYRNKEAVREAALKKLREDRAKEKEHSKGFER